MKSKSYKSTLGMLLSIVSWGCDQFDSLFPCRFPNPLSRYASCVDNLQHQDFFVILQKEPITQKQLILPKDTNIIVITIDPLDFEEYNFFEAQPAR